MMTGVTYIAFFREGWCNYVKPVIRGAKRVQLAFSGMGSGVNRGITDTDTICSLQALLKTLIISLHSTNR